MTSELWLFGYPLVLMLVDFNLDTAFFGRVMIKPGISITSMLLIIAPLIVKKSVDYTLVNQQTWRQRRNSGQLRSSQNTADDTNSTLVRLSSKNKSDEGQRRPGIDKLEFFQNRREKASWNSDLSRVPSERSTKLYD
jgi:hypothetical protein